ncbi:hypothetical protein N7520_006451 [Penicillium odoratum]|uniref:uncharacterized protein n=1 Tax=Penicillium odoratum TaxID=1167516 RepID=UPI002548F16D|nr:uncharacterized protein N7520_006451 [Penicillium odoratum]KAJ5759295.1 hypothetical protein N7520_006451 [Penicillium odoratum]
MVFVIHLSTAWQILAIATLFALFCVTGFGIYNLFFHPLRKYPGPRLWAASLFPSLWYFTHGELIYKLRELHEQYGDVVRIAPDEVVYIGQEAQKDIYAFGGGSGPFVKSPDFYFSLGGSHSIVTTPKNAEHAKIRKLLGSSFSEKAIREQEPAVMNFINLFIKRLHERAHQGPQDLSKWFNLITFDVIGDLAFGEPFGSVDSGDYHPWVRTMTQNNLWSVLVGSAQRLPLIQPLLQYLIPATLKEERAQMIAYTKDKVARRIPQGSTRTDFMSPLLRADSFSIQELELNAMTFVVAGSDTTASLLSGLTYHLCLNPHVLDRLTAEVRSAFRSDDEINMTSVNSLKYEMAVLKEGLRIFPPASAGLPRRVPEGGATVAGEWVPEGTRVHVSPWASYQSSSRFYLPQSFIPERWLGDPRFANDDLKIITPFSIGPRNCIGMK